MCRHRLYFKGMYKVIPIWEEERFEQQRDQAFAEAVEQILDEDGDTLMADPMEVDEEDDESVWETASESESESGSDYTDDEYEGWSFDSSDSRLSDIADIQDQFNIFCNIGIDPSIFVQAYAEGAVFERDQFWWEDFPVKKELFVSKHGMKPVGSPRLGSRLRPMGICV